MKKDALYKKIESLPEDVQKMLEEMPRELLIQCILSTTHPLQNNKVRAALLKPMLEHMQFRMLEKDLPVQRPRKIPTPGAFLGQIKIAPDFDDPIPGLEDYMV
jgi:hypothetical protein